MLKINILSFPGHTVISVYTSAIFSHGYKSEKSVAFVLQLHTYTNVHWVIEFLSQLKNQKLRGSPVVYWSRHSTTKWKVSGSNPVLGECF